MIYHSLRPLKQCVKNNFWEINFFKYSSINNDFIGVNPKTLEQKQLDISNE